MATNDFLPFATSSTNILTQAEYIADDQRVSGNVPGVARSKLVNKAARQSAFVSAMIGQFIVDQASLDALDDGNLATLGASYLAALKAVISGVLPAGSIQYFAMSAAPSNWLKANGAAVSRATYAALAANIYCGDALNATALFGYRCTDPANPSTSRSTTGGYIVLPDLRGEFVRGWDDGRGVDAGRVFGSAQGSEVGPHAHNLDSAANTQINGPGWFMQAGTATLAGLPKAGGVVTSTGSETRPRNVALLACIKY